VPFYVSTKGYGIVLDTMRYTCFYCASSKLHKSDGIKEIADKNDSIKTSAQDLYASKSYDGVITAEITGAKGMHGYLFAGDGSSGLDPGQRHLRQN